MFDFFDKSSRRTIKHDCIYSYDDAWVRAVHAVTLRYLLVEASVYLPFICLRFIYSGITKIRKNVTGFDIRNAKYLIYGSVSIYCKYSTENAVIRYGFVFGIGNFLGMGVPKTDRI